MKKLLFFLIIFTTVFFVIVQSTYAAGRGTNGANTQNSSSFTELPSSAWIMKTSKTKLTSNSWFELPSGKIVPILSYMPTDNKWWDDIDNALAAQFEHDAKILLLCTQSYITAHGDVTKGYLTTYYVEQPEFEKAIEGKYIPVYYYQKTITDDIKKRFNIASDSSMDMIILDENGKEIAREKEPGNDVNYLINFVNSGAGLTPQSQSVKTNIQKSSTTLDGVNLNKNLSSTFELPSGKTVFAPILTKMPFEDGWIKNINEGLNLAKQQKKKVILLWALTFRSNHGMTKGYSATYYVEQPEFKKAIDGRYIPVYYYQKTITDDVRKKYNISSDSQMDMIILDKNGKEIAREKEPGNNVNHLINFVNSVK